MPISRRASLYIRFMHLVNAMRQMPSLPALDAVEERMLSMFVTAWEAGKRIPMMEAARMEPGTPERTAFRRIKSLHEKGMLAFDLSAGDQRVKYIVPTKGTAEYFDALGKCLQQAWDGAWTEDSPAESEPG